MPDFVECLADVQENGCAILLVFQCFIYYICKTVTLLYSRMRFSETELMLRYPRLEMCIIVYRLSRSFSKILDHTGKRLIGLYDAT